MCYSQKDRIDSCLLLRGWLLFLAKKVKNKFLYLHNVSQTSIWENFANNILLYSQVGRKKKIKSHNIVYMKGTRPSEEMWIIKDSSGSLNTAEQHLPLTFGVWRCKTVSRLRAKEKPTTERVAERSEGAAARLVPTGVVLKVPAEHLCAPSSPPHRSSAIPLQGRSYPQASAQAPPLTFIINNISIRISHLQATFKWSKHLDLSDLISSTRPRGWCEVSLWERSNVRAQKACVPRCNKWPYPFQHSLKAIKTLNSPPCNHQQAQDCSLRTATKQGQRPQPHLTPCGIKQRDSRGSDLRTAKRALALEALLVAAHRNECRVAFHWGRVRGCGRFPASGNGRGTTKGQGAGERGSAEIKPPPRWIKSEILRGWVICGCHPTQSHGAPKRSPRYRQAKQSPHGVNRELEEDSWVPARVQVARQLPNWTSLEFKPIITLGNKGRQAVPSLQSIGWVLFYWYPSTPLKLGWSNAMAAHDCQHPVS